MTPGLVLSVASFATVAGNFAWYYPKMTANAAPLKPRVAQVLMAAALAVAIASFFLRPGIVGAVIGALPILPATLFLLGTFTSGLPRQIPTVSVGSPAPDFAGTDADGDPFRLSERRGTPVLLKFYRGYWCPYCVAELQQLDRHRGEFAALGVRLVAVSADRADELASFKRKRDWAITLVADPTIAIQRLYNVQQRNYTPRRGPFREMAIPTTVLIDAEGTVLWIDQASDFRVRPQASMVLAKTRALLAERSAMAAEECGVCAA
jgi:peroxiredoxin